MPFVKLDCGILASTIWYDYPACRIFLTALLMAEPREYVEPTPQMFVRSLENTGWVARPGWYGYVPSSGIGIIRRAGDVGEEDGYSALERLGSAEAGSRSQEHDGRRLIRIDGGYLVLNYDKYRERDYGAAERMRRLRERRKQGDGVRRNSVTVPPNVTHTDTEADTEASSPPSSEKEEKKNLASLVKKKASKDLVEELVVDYDMRKWAEKTAPGIDVDKATDDWRDHFRANGYRTKNGPVKDAAAAWRTWMKNAHKFAQGGGNGRKSGVSIDRAPSSAPSGEIPLRDRLLEHKPTVDLIIETFGDPDRSRSALVAFNEQATFVSGPEDERWARWTKLCEEAGLE